jgi:hypothetical protein
MGHSSPRAALIYLHVTRDRDKKIAAGMGKLFKDATKDRSDSQARNGHGVGNVNLDDSEQSANHATEQREKNRAGDGNRTRVTSLEDRYGCLWGDLLIRTF